MNGFTFDPQDHLRDMEKRLMDAILLSRQEFVEATRELRSELESYQASFIVHEQRIIAVENTAKNVKRLSLAALTALCGVVLDFVRTKFLGL
jgi:hypothetical protein